MVQVWFFSTSWPDWSHYACSRCYCISTASHYFLWVSSAGKLDCWQVKQSWRRTAGARTHLGQGCVPADKCTKLAGYRCVLLSFPLCLHDLLLKSLLWICQWFSFVRSPADNRMKDWGKNVSVCECGMLFPLVLATNVPPCSSIYPLGCPVLPVAWCPSQVQYKGVSCMCVCAPRCTRLWVLCTYPYSLMYVHHFMYTRTLLWSTLLCVFCDY